MTRSFTFIQKQYENIRKRKIRKEIQEYPNKPLERMPSWISWKTVIKLPLEFDG